jgi:hypothetical protein
MWVLFFYLFMDKNSFDISKIEAYEAIQGLGRHEKNDERRKKQEHHPPSKKNAAAYFHTLSKAAQASNAVCAKKGLPYRFRVYLEKNEIFIAREILDKNGTILQVTSKNISGEDFARLIEDVTNIEGLFLDTLA